MAAPHLFSDEDFAAFYSDRMGRPSVPPAQLALMTLLQHEAGCSDAEAVARSGYDLRWAAVLRRAAGQPLCAKSTFQLFRAHLLLHDEVRTIFQRSLEVANRAGLLRGGALQIAVDTKPILGRGAALDAYNLLGSGIEQLVRALARVEGKKPSAWAAEHDLGRYFGPSLKGSADLDWSDPAAKEPVSDRGGGGRAAALAAGGGPAPRAGSASGGATPRRRRATGAVAAAGRGGDDGPRRQATGFGSGRDRPGSDAARPRTPRCGTGERAKAGASRGTKPPSPPTLRASSLWMWTCSRVTPRMRTGLLQQVERVEANTGQSVEQTLGDCAYGSGATRQAFADAGRVLLAKVPQENPNGGRFRKSAFLLDLAGDTVTCPGGAATNEFSVQQDGSKLFQFRGLLGLPAPAGVHDGGFGANDPGAPAGGTARGRAQVAAHAGRASDVATAGGGGTSAGAAGAARDRPGALRGESEDPLPTADRRYGCQPATDLELGKGAARGVHWARRGGLGAHRDRRPDRPSGHHDPAGRLHDGFGDCHPPSVELDRLARTLTWRNGSGPRAGADSAVRSLKWHLSATLLELAFCGTAPGGLMLPGLSVPERSRIIPLPPTAAPVRAPLPVATWWPP